MAIITLTSDWNKHDYYAGMLKGRILRMLPDAGIIDLCHDIQSFHSLQGAFVLRHALKEFPEDTMHIFLVNQGQNSDNYPVVCRYKKQFILAWNDPVLGLLFEEEPDYCIQISPELFSGINGRDGSRQEFTGYSASFPELTLFPKIVKWLDETPQDSLMEIERITIDQSPWEPVIQEGAITGRVLYIDSYNNAISNISLSLFRELHQDKKFDILVKNNHFKITEISQTYAEAEPGDLIALFNSVGFLEIAMIQAPVGELLSLEPGSTIKVKFYE